MGVKAIEHDISNKNPKSKIDIDIAVKTKIIREWRRLLGE